MKIFNSSVVDEIDPIDKTVTLKNGNKYQYTNASRDEMQEMILSPSVGKHFNMYFNRRADARKVN